MTRIHPQHHASQGVMKDQKGAPSVERTGQGVRTANSPVTQTNIIKTVVIIFRYSDNIDPETVARVVMRSIRNHIDYSDLKRYTKGEYSRANIEAFVADALGEE